MSKFYHLPIFCKNLTSFSFYIIVRISGTVRKISKPAKILEWVLNPSTQITLNQTSNTWNQMEWPVFKKSETIITKDNIFYFPFCQTRDNVFFLKKLSTQRCLKPQEFIKSKWLYFWVDLDNITFAFMFYCQINYNKNKLQMKTKNTFS